MPQITIIGLGYVGLPLAIAFSKKYPTIGFDLSESKINNYMNGIDPSAQITPEEFSQANNLSFTTNPQDISDTNYIIVTVPTPIDNAKKPDLSCIIAASKTVAKYMQPGTTIIYESTVYPGTTEEVCVPVLEEVSNLRWKQDFNVAYSPERINPGDNEHKLENITKIVSGDTPATLAKVTKLYESIINADIFQASSIKVAEAAKVIENTQRDVNIALMNELAMIFDRLNIDTNEVIKAASTKWNFLPFKPGLVGGHCIGVDPYYLTHKAEMVGYHPQVILSGREVNDGMGKFIAESTVKLMLQNNCDLNHATIIIFGITFKENCPDIRNSKVVDIIKELELYNIKNIIVHDPIADDKETMQEYNINLTQWDKLPTANAIIMAVPHKEFLEYNITEYINKLDNNACLIDVKSVFEKCELEKHNLTVWRL